MQPKIIEIVQEASKQEKLNNIQIDFIGGNDKGEGFLGEIQFIKVTDKDTQNVLNLVVKKAFAEDKIRLASPIRNTFLNEINFYKNIWPIYKKFQDGKQTSRPFDAVAKYYHSSVEEKEEVVVLENLKMNGFQIYDKKVEINESHIRMILDNYARFHALGYALKEADGEEFKRIQSMIVDVYEHFKDMVFFQDSIQKVFDQIKDSLDQVKDARLIQEWNEHFTNTKEAFSKVYQYRGKYSTFIHGDCWSNNMMFKYNSAGELVDMKLLDFQILRLGSPVHDLSYCIYSGANQEVINNLESYLEFYHNQLTQHLKELGYDSAHLYPYEILKQHWKQYGKFGLFLGLLIRKMKLTEKADIVDFKDIEDFEKVDDNKFVNAPVDSKFYDVSKDLVKHLSEIGAL